MRKLVIALALAFAPTLLHAATMQVEQHEGETRLVIEGDINVGDGDRFLARVANLRPTQLEMNSPGGDVDSGTVIARWVHENPQIKVVVDDYCNSACSYAALVALGRGDLTVNASSSLGVHQVSDVYDDRPSKANVGWTKRAADTLRGYGAPEEPLVAMVATPPRSIVSFDAAVLEKMGATVAQTGLPDLPNLPKIPMPDLPAGPDVTAPVGIATLAILILLLFGLTLAFRRMAPATNKEHTMKFNKQMRRDRKRGLEVNYTQLYAAYLIEAGIIVASAYAGYEFAQRYVSDDWQLWIMAIVGTFAVALAEIARIQLAKTTRTQSGWLMKALAIVGVVCMCAITTKSMSQVMDQVFSPRLRQVQVATDQVNIAEADLASAAGKRGSTDKALEPLQQRVDDANRRIEEINANIQTQGKAPGPKAVKRTVKSTCWSKRNTKHWSCNKTITEMVNVPWAGQQFADQLEAAYAERDAAVVARDIAAKSVAREVEGVLGQEKRVAELKHTQREAVARSQLHSFTAMVFGVDPVDVTNAQVHWFLRFFVLLPAFAISIASTLLAVTAYRNTERPVRQSEAVEIDRSKTLERHIESVVNATIERRERTNEDATIHPFVKEAGNDR